MQLSRRQILKSSAGAAALLTGASACNQARTDAQADSSVTPTPKTIKLDISTYSYWHFKETKYPCEKRYFVPGGLEQGNSAGLFAGLL